MFISGATDGNAASINGFFEPTQEKGLNGRVLYSKRGDAGKCMEHFNGKWQVKTVSSKGKDVCYANVEGGCALAACTSRQWKVGDGKTFSDAPGVKMVTGAEAERKVSGCCLRAHQHALLPPVGASNRFL